jgi:hypothetical protein
MARCSAANRGSARRVSFWAMALYTMGSSTRRRCPCGAQRRCVRSQHDASSGGGKRHPAPHLRRIVLAQLLAHQQLHVLGALERPLPVQVGVGLGHRQLQVGGDDDQPVLQAGQLAAVVGLEDGLHVDERHQHVARLHILQQQVPAGPVAGFSVAACTQCRVTCMHARPFGPTPLARPGLQPDGGHVL